MFGYTPFSEEVGLKKKKVCGIIFLMLFTFLSLSSGCVVLMCVCISSIAAQTEQTPRFSCLTSEWVPQKYPLQLSSVPHFSISPLSSTLPTPLALSCHSAFYVTVPFSLTGGSSSKWQNGKGANTCLLLYW